MTLEEIVRQRTLELRDALRLLEDRIEDLREQRDAAEDQRKRASTEISMLHFDEHEAKRARNATEQQLAGVREKLESIEEQRSALIEQLMELQHQQDGAERLLTEAKARVERAEVSMRHARGEVERLAKDLGKALEEKTEHGLRLKKGYLGALDEYLAEAARRFEQTISGEQDRQRHVAVLEAFRKARHEDPDVGNWCEQRDQLRELLKQVTVPAVREKVQALLADVEMPLSRLYPGALSMEEVSSQSTPVEDLYYFTSRDGKACILAPVTEVTWKALEEGKVDISTTATVHAVWNLVASLGIGPSDGEFRMADRRCVLSSRLSHEEISDRVALRGSAPEACGIQFRLAPLSSEIQEVLSDEA